MKKFIKVFAAVSALVLLAAACAQRTCPTYSQQDVEKDSTIEATV